MSRTEVRDWGFLTTKKIKKNIRIPLDQVLRDRSVDQEVKQDFKNFVIDVEEVFIQSVLDKRKIDIQKIVNVYGFKVPFYYLDEREL